MFRLESVVKLVTEEEAATSIDLPIAESRLPIAANSKLPLAAFGISPKIMTSTLAITLHTYLHYV